MKTKFMNDQELIDMYLSGDDRGLNELVNRYQKRLYAFIFTKTKDTHLADDIFQETVIKVINSIRTGKYFDKGKFISWAMRIAYNMMMDHFRAKKKEALINNDTEDFDIFDVLRSPDENVIDKLITAQIHGDVIKLIKALPEEQREIVILRHYNKWSFAEIAEELDINMNTALGRMRYALKNIRRMIKEQNLMLTVQ
jgi:RNA polymerase sigma factor (sigma-70 family)